MKTNRRDFLGLVGAAFGALALPRTQRPPEAPLPQPPAPLPPLEENSILTFKDIEPLNVDKHDLWQPKHDSYVMHNMAGESVAVADYNFREEFEGPIELLNVGGQLDGPLVIRSKTVTTGRGGMCRVIVKAVRYPKVL
jgi:hypothetical protein